MPIGRRTRLVSAAAIPLAAYGGGLWALAALHGTGPGSVRVFQEGLSGGGAVLAGTLSALVFASGFLLLFAVPGGLFLLSSRRARKDPGAFAGLAFALSLGSLFLTTTLWKVLLGAELTRGSLLGIVVLHTILGLMLCLKEREAAGQDRFLGKILRPGPGLAFALGATALVALSAPLRIGPPGAVFLDGRAMNFDYSEEAVGAIPLGDLDDNHELFGLADSLRRRVLPYWDLEYAEGFGFVFIDPPAYPFVTMAAALFFGESMASIELIAIGSVIAAFLVVLWQGGKDKSARGAACLLLFTAYLVHLRRFPQMSVLHAHFFNLLLMGTWAFLLSGRDRMFLLFAGLALLTRFYAVYYCGLALGLSWILFPERRKRLAGLAKGCALIALGVFLGVAAVGIATGNLEVYAKSNLIEHFARFDYPNLLPRLFPGLVVGEPDIPFRLKLDFPFICLQATAFTLPVFLLFGKDREERFYSWFALVFIAAIMLNRVHPPRYAAPVIPLAGMMLALKLERLRRIS